MESKIEELVQTLKIDNNNWCSVVNDNDGGYTLSYNDESLWVKIYYKDEIFLNIYNQKGNIIENVVYFPNGSIKQRKSYYRNIAQLYTNLSFDFEGRRTGLYIDYYSNGVVRKRCNFRRNKLHGYYYSYHSNGNIYVMNHYNFGNEHGAKEVYSLEGNIKLKLNHSNGILHGYSYSYYPNGFVKQEDNYKYGKIINMKKYYKNGYIKMFSEWENNKLSGNRTKYWKDGSIKSVCLYKNGVKDGVWKYFENDKCLEEVEYKNGTKQCFYTYSCDGYILNSGKY